jgi:hypothetical protein
MTEELDPQLLALFATSRESSGDAQFLAATLAKIERELRRRVLYRAAALIAAIFAAIWLAPWLLEHTAQMFGAALEGARPRVEFASSPWAWVASVPIGLFVIFRSVGSRR